MRRVLVLLCAAAVFGLPTADVARAVGQPAARHSIVGVWQVEVTVRQDGPDCTVTPPVPFGQNPFPALNTFHKGGTVSETGSRSPPSRRSPGHGVWQRVGPGAYEARYTFQVFDGNGFLSNIMDIRTDIELAQDGRTFQGVSRFQFSDVSGNVVPFCATMEAVRYGL
ncbi:hypothetical protein [Lentisalinibacter salinarum]|uniref:hypothetical protein n=1 Tax=Lentisalinibacter salinarum TaxID=2992239 RepID=UPI00386C966F